MHLHLFRSDPRYGAPRYWAALCCAGLLTLTACSDGAQSGNPAADQGPADPITPAGDAGVPGAGSTEDDASVETTLDQGTTVECERDCPPIDAPQLPDPPEAPQLPAITVACEGPWGAEIALDICAAIDAEAVIETIEWSGPVEMPQRCDPMVRLPVGQHDLSVTLTDPHGRSAVGRTTIAIVDEEPPDVRLTTEARFVEPETCGGRVDISLWDVGEGDRCAELLSYRWWLDDEPLDMETGAAQIDLRAGGLRQVTVEACDPSGQCTTDRQWVGRAFAAPEPLDARPWRPALEDEALQVSGRLEGPCGGNLDEIVSLGGFVAINGITFDIPPEGAQMRGAHRASFQPEQARRQAFIGEGALTHLSTVDGELVINGHRLPVDAEASVAAQAEAINAVTLLTGVSAWTTPAVVPLAGPPQGGEVTAEMQAMVDDEALTGLAVEPQDADGTLWSALHTLDGVTLLTDGPGPWRLVRFDGGALTLNVDEAAGRITGLPVGERVARGELVLWSPQSFTLGEGAERRHITPSNWDAPSARAGTTINASRPLESEALMLNGVAIPAAAPAASARQMSRLVEGASALTSVHSSATAARLDAPGPIAGDVEPVEGLIINGVQLPAVRILPGDFDGALLQTIDAHSDETGVTSTLNAQGHLSLIAPEGDNIQLEGPVQALGFDALPEIASGAVMLWSASTFEIAGDAEAIGWSASTVFATQPVIRAPWSVEIADGGHVTFTHHPPLPEALQGPLEIELYLGGVRATLHSEEAHDAP
ncbi:MAG: hypothetical protein ACE366_18635 [Bradymonadia bacterium]